MKSTLIAAAAVLAFTGAPAQEAFLSTNQSLISLNPSYAGSNKGMRFQGSYASTYFYGPNVPFTAVADFYVPHIKGGIALSWSGGEWHGAVFNSRAGITYAYQFSTEDRKVKLIPSIQIGYGTTERYALNWYSAAQGNYKTRYFDFGTGLLIQLCDRLVIGGSLNNLNRTVQKGEEDYLFVRPATQVHAALTVKRTEATLIQVSYRLGFQNGGAFHDKRMLNQLGGDFIFLKHLVTGAGFAMTRQEYMFNDGSTRVIIFDRPYANIGYRGKKCSLSLQVQPKMVRNQGYNGASGELHFSVNLSKPDPAGRLATFENF